MTRKALLLTAAVLLSSCAVAGLPVSHWTMDEALAFVADSIAYAPEAYGEDYWQTPTETLRLKSGDCEDMAILFMWLTGRGDLAIISWFGGLHAVVVDDGIMYDPTWGFSQALGNRPILSRVPYDDVETKYF